MKCILFLGPTLSGDDARKIFADLPIDSSVELVIRPPVSQGDVLRAIGESPDAIGLVDGYFHQVPSVWHKEILDALSKGIAVFGSASMGALRAVETAPFGMVGVGRIFETFAQGDLEDDDEVAVAHGPVESGYLSLSEPMVNIRFNVQEAVDQGLLQPDIAELLVRRAKSVFYARRHWQDLREWASDSRIFKDSDAEQAFWSWLDENRFCQKKRDAEEMLRVIHRVLMSGEGTVGVSHVSGVQPPSTVFFARLQEEVQLRHVEKPASEDLRRVLDELRLQGLQTYEDVKQRVRLRCLRQSAERHSAPPSETEIDDYVRRFRRDKGLIEPADTVDWLKLQAWSPDEFMAAAEQNLLDVRHSEPTKEALGSTLGELLRWDGVYGLWLERSRSKDGLRGTAFEPKLDDETLWSWYFEDRLGREIPRDMVAYAERLDFPDLATFRSAVVLERKFQLEEERDG